jgi:hypothetical protein
MKKALVGSVVAVLLVGTSAMAQIDVQFQTWDFAIGDNISLSGGGPIGANTIQGIGNLSKQDLTSGVATAQQCIGTALFQSGEANSQGSDIGLIQNLTVAGLGMTAPFSIVPGQVQSVAVGGGALTESQGVGVAGDQTIQKTGDTAADAEALTLVAFGMDQGAGNSCNMASECALVIGGSFSSIDGKCDSLGTVMTTMGATVIQLQQAH